MVESIIFRTILSVLLAIPVWGLVDIAIAEFKCDDYTYMTLDLCMAGLIVLFISTLWYGV